MKVSITKEVAGLRFEMTVQTGDLATNTLFGDEKVAVHALCDMAANQLAERLIRLAALRGKEPTP